MMDQVVLKQLFGTLSLFAEAALQETKRIQLEFTAHIHPVFCASQVFLHDLISFRMCDDHLNASQVSNVGVISLH